MLYKIEDILYQNNGKGQYLTSKVGEKYDERRGKVIVLYEEDITIGFPYVLNYIGVPGYIITTPVQSIYKFTPQNSAKEYTYLATSNSIYVLSEVHYKVEQTYDKQYY